MSKRSPKILVIDDEPNMCRSLKIFLEDEGHFEVITALSGEEGLTRLKEEVDVVLTDLSMPGMDGIEVLKACKKFDEDIQVILFTAYSTVKSAIEAMKADAFEYVIKPFENDQLLVIINNALKLSFLSRRNKALEEQLRERYSIESLIGQSKVLQDILFLLERAAETDATVLITGESGTGKELCARAIHHEGNRKEGPFVAINCSALPDTLLESELFGHEKGAFTGAIKTKLGLFERANKGTIFLDEIGEMSLSLQTKLLRALQDKSFQRVGGTELITVDIRIIAATNKDLQVAIQEQQFREDLFYRLNVIPIRLPPLRDRLDDVPLLTAHILEKKCAELGRPPVALSAEAEQLLLSYDYPGNIRELENILERAIVIARHPIIGPEDLPIRKKEPIKLILSNYIDGCEGAWGKIQQLSKDLEKQLIEKAIREYHDRSHEEIASILGTSRRIFELRLQEYNISKSRR